MPVELIWERVESYLLEVLPGKKQKIKDDGLCLERAKVPSGWLVREAGVGLTFVADAEGKWQ